MSSFLLLSIERRTFGFWNSSFDFLDTGIAGFAGFAGTARTAGTARISGIAGIAGTTGIAGIAETATATSAGSLTGTGTSMWAATGVAV